MYAIALLITVCFLFNSCSTRIEEENKFCIKALDSFKFYQVSSFKSWLLLDSKDSRYAPLRLSMAALQPRDRRSFSLTSEKCSSSFSLIPEKCFSRYNPTEEPWPINLSPAIVLKEANYNKDINVFIEQLDLKELAKICYNGQEGEIYYIIGERKPFPHSQSLITAGWSANNPMPYIPVYFATDSSLDLSILMDNIWLLYQLSINNLIESYAFKEKNKWKWSKIAYKFHCNKKEKIINLPNSLKKRFAILEHIQRPKGINILPPISYRSCETNEDLSTEINEMRAGEGYIYCDDAYVYDLLPREKQKLSWKALINQYPCNSSFIQKQFKGNELWLNTTNRQHFSDLDSEYKKERAISQYELFVFPVGINKYYQNKRKIELIFDSNQM